ncbi:CvpA family protein [bacterium]|nr:CvpA family protein [candidate division CSSED10-310 bacterium]
MNALDYILLIVTGLPGITGLFKGFIRMAFGLAGVVGGIVLSIAFVRPLGDWMDGRFGLSEPFLARLMAFTAIFLLSTVCGILGGRLARKLLETANLGMADRLLGWLMGIIQGAVIAGVALMVLSVLPVTRPWVETSMTGSALVTGVHWMVHRLPGDWHDYFSPQRWIGESRSAIIDTLIPPPPAKTEDPGSPSNSTEPPQPPTASTSPDSTQP